MDFPIQKSYHALIIDFVGPVDKRHSIYSMAPSQIANFYEKKPVSDFFWRFEQLFRKYSDAQTLEATIKAKGFAQFSCNRPNTLYANAFNPNQQLYLVIAEDRVQIDRLIRIFKLK